MDLCACRRAWARGQVRAEANPIDRPLRAVTIVAASIAVGLLALQPAAAFNERMVDAVARARASVVTVLPDWPSGIGRVEEPEGSGVVVADGRVILTADHVVGAAKTLRIRLDNGDILTAEIAFRDVETDIAILSLVKPLPPISFAAQSDAGEARPGEPVCAIGNAFGLGLSVTCGVVSAVHRAGIGFNRIEDFVQSDTSVNPGASGGALIDSDGRLVGMLSAIFTKGTDADIGVNFAVSAPLLQAVLAQYEKTGAVSHLRLGVALKSEPDERRSGPVGLRVLRVEPGSLAERSGLAVNDLLTAVNGSSVTSIEGLRGRLAVAGDDAIIRLVRADKTLHVSLKTSALSK